VGTAPPRLRPHPLRRPAPRDLQAAATYPGPLALKTWRHPRMWRSIQHNNTTPIIRMRFSGTSLLGKQGQICFAEYFKIVIKFFAYFFVRTGWTCDFVLKQTKGGGVLDEIWHLWTLKIAGVGDKHPHDSDHAECAPKTIFGIRPWSWLIAVPVNTCTGVPCTVHCSGRRVACAFNAVVLQNTRPRGGGRGGGLAACMLYWSLTRPRSI